MGARKTESGNNSDKETGTVLTVSLFLILLTFFILLSSVSITDMKKKQAVSESLSGSFRGFPGGSPVIKTADNEDFSGFLSGTGDPGGGNINLKTGKNMQTLVIGESALFHPDSHLLKSGSAPLLKKLGGYIKTGKHRIEIAGHTDNRDPEEKGYRSNHELSSLMAIQIQKYLIEESGADPERLMAYGCGSGYPEASNDTRESREKNRRIEIILKGMPSAGLKRVHIEPPGGIFSYRGFNFRIYSDEKKNEK